MNVLIIGASNKPDRFSYKALKMLQAAGHTVFLVHPVLKDIEGLPVYADLTQVKEKIDTITLYVNAETSTKMENEILSVKPSRIIFNPGTENRPLFEKAKHLGIEAVENCTLVMLGANQF